MDALTFLQTHVALFAGIPEEQLAPLAASATLSSYNAGATVLFKGMTVDGLHIVCNGTVTVHVKLPGKAVGQVAELGQGEVFGETSIVEQGTAGATVKAGAGGAMVLMIPQEAFRHLLQLDEVFAVRVNTLIRSRKAAPADPQAA